MNTYLLGCLLLFPVWLYLAFQPQTQKKLLKLSLVFGIIGWLAGGYLALADYWHPPYWNTTARLEDFLWGALYAGIVTALPFDARYVNKKTHSQTSFKVFCVLTVALIFTAWYYFPIVNSIYAHCAPPIVLGAVVLYITRDASLIWRTAASSCMAIVLIFVWYQILLLVEPSFIAKHWKHENLMGIEIFQVPIEEIFFAGSLGLGRYVYEFATGRLARSV